MESSDPPDELKTVVFHRHPDFYEIIKFYEPNFNRRLRRMVYDKKFHTNYSDDENVPNQK
jgi:hypothetical protein